MYKYGMVYLNNILERYSDNPKVVTQMFETLFPILFLLEYNSIVYITFQLSPRASSSPRNIPFP
jgi:hypothetical protein